jgi:hypothetical protein
MRGLGGFSVFNIGSGLATPSFAPNLDGVIMYSDAETVRTYLDEHPDADLQSAATGALLRYESVINSEQCTGMELFCSTQQQEVQQIIENLVGRGVDFSAVMKTLPPQPAQALIPKTPENDASFKKNRAALTAYVSSYVSKLARPASLSSPSPVPAKKFTGPCTAETFEAEMNLDQVWGQIEKAYATDKSLTTNRYTSSYGPDPKCRLDFEIDTSRSSGSKPKLTGGQAWINGRYSKDLSEQISNELGTAPDPRAASGK